MNVKEAKEQIEIAMKAYFTKDQFGSYIIPIEKQRPVILIGPPGVGKTAIMEQIASDLNVGLLSYSMTHHTRQSALGLPFIEKKLFNGVEYNVTEYTMSEIIASVYEMMEETGVEEGILFLDEINCVSETLTPIMLQFLQYKVFGQHRVPDGWIVVAAGNPPEYNDTAREYDIVTWDRLKGIDVEPDYSIWKEYAYKSGVHPSILTYLDEKKSNFYKIVTTVDGKQFVTARGWSDLSDMIKLCEMHNITVEENLISQYIQNPKIAKEFAVYYDLFNKYKSDYQIHNILSGKVNKEIEQRVKSAKFDELLCLLGMLIDHVNEDTKEICLSEGVLRRLLKSLKEVKAALSKSDFDIYRELEKQIKQCQSSLNRKRKSVSLSTEEKYFLNSTIAFFEKEIQSLKVNNVVDKNEAFNLLKKDYGAKVTELRKKAQLTTKKLSNLFAFGEDVMKNDQLMLILVTELTISYYSSQFIARYGCDGYYRNNKALLFHERQKEIITELYNLDIDI